MKIFPAIDLYKGKVVRLLEGRYEEMTVYSENPIQVAEDFKANGAEFIHIVDLEGAKNGTTPNLDMVKEIKRASRLFCEIGGGIRSMEAVDKYMSVGIDRVILGTAAVTNRDFLKSALDKYGEKIAVGVDIKDGFVAIKGWLEKSEEEALGFCRKMEALGVETIIVTDISRDGAMRGTNRELYKRLIGEVNMQIVASGGVSSSEDVKSLAETGIYGAIIGKAYYTGAIELGKVIEEAEERRRKDDK